MILLPLAALLTSGTMPLVAFAERIYYPGLKRISLHQVYICSFDGSRRRQITHDRREHVVLGWLDSNRLVWESAVADFGKSRDYGSSRAGPMANAVRRRHFPPRKTYVFDLRNRQTRRVPDAVARHLWFPEFPIHEAALIREKDDGKSLVRTWNVAGHEVTRIQNGYEDGKHRRDGKDYDFEIPGYDRKFWCGNDPNKCWILSDQSRFSQNLYEVDWTTGQSKCVVPNISVIDFTGDHGLWTAVEGEPRVESLGAVQVWSGKVYSGDIRTGKRYLLTPGVVHCDNPVIQPMPSLLR